MKILFFDTETTGLPLDYDEPYTNVKYTGISSATTLKAPTTA